MIWSLLYIGSQARQQMALHKGFWPVVTECAGTQLWRTVEWANCGTTRWWSITFNNTVFLNLILRLRCWLKRRENASSTKPQILTTKSFSFVKFTISFAWTVKTLPVFCLTGNLWQLRMYNWTDLFFSLLSRWYFGRQNWRFCGTDNCFFL